MKFYIAARFGLKEEVRAIYRRQQASGHQVTMDWTEHLPLKPYAQNPDIAKAYSIEDLQGVRDCDVFLLLSDEAGTGMYAELGAAIATKLERGRPEIFVVGPHNARSLFYFPPAVQRETHLDHVLMRFTAPPKTG